MMKILKRNISIFWIVICFISVLLITSCKNKPSDAFYLDYTFVLDSLIWINPIHQLCIANNEIIISGYNTLNKYFENSLSLQPFLMTYPRNSEYISFAILDINGKHLKNYIYPFNLEKLDSNKGIFKYLGKFRSEIFTKFCRLKNGNMLLFYNHINPRSEEFNNNELLLIDSNGNILKNYNNKINSLFTLNENMGNDTIKIYKIININEKEFIFIGNFVYYNGIKCNHIVKIKLNGEIDPLFIKNTKFIRKITNFLTIDNNLILFGEFNLLKKFKNQTLVKLNYEGKIDSNFSKNVKKFNYKNIVAVRKKHNSLYFIAKKLNYHIKSQQFYLINIDLNGKILSEIGLQNLLKYINFKDIRIISIDSLSNIWIGCKNTNYSNRNIIVIDTLGFVKYNNSEFFQKKLIGDINLIEFPNKDTIYVGGELDYYDGKILNQSLLRFIKSKQDINSKGDGPFLDYDTTNIILKIDRTIPKNPGNNL